MKCKWCPAKAVRKQGRIWLCKKHYRFQQMRCNAKRHGKSVPSYEELESLWTESGGRCPTCDRTFNWLSVEGTGTVVSLQHDRNGGRRLLCRSCNTRHASFSGDSFYSTDPQKRICPRCRKSLPLSSFSRDKSRRWKTLNTYCRTCRAALHATWVAKNRKKYNEKRRQYYHRRKASGNPIPR